MRNTILLLLVLAAGCTEKNEASVDSDDAGAVSVDGSVSPDGAVGDAGIEDPDGAVIPDAAGQTPCERECERVAACAGDLCPDIESVDADCMTACEDNRSFAIVSAGIVQCEELVGYAGQNIEPLAECEGGPLETPACEGFAEVIARCIGEQCAPAADESDRFEAFYLTVCNLQVEQGGANPDDLAAAFPAGTPCNAPAVVGVVNNVLNGDPERPDDEGLGAYCDDGPVLPTETCTQACENIAPCIPEDDESAYLRDLPVCEQVCLTQNEQAAPAWTCASEQPMCVELFACFQPPEVPPVEGCDTLSSLVAECLPETCEAAGPLSDGILATLVPICAQAAQAGDLSAEDLEGLSADGGCEQPFLQQVIELVTAEMDDEGEPGLYYGLCSEGPLVSAETCATACAHLGPCIGPDDDGAALREPGICAYFCGLDPTFDAERWACIEAADGGCGEVGACFVE